MSMHVLLIENNNLDQAASLVSALENQACRVAMAHTPEMAVQKAETLWPNLVVFNPINSRLKLSNFQKALDEINLNIPYVVVGDESHLSTSTKIETTLIAPGNHEQLTHGIEKALVRQQGRFIRLPNLVIDCQRRQLLHHNDIYHLTPKGFKLLQLLIEHQNQDLSRKAIMKEVWETDYLGDTRTLDVHIRWLREKIEDDPSHPQRLITIRGIGYRFITKPE